MIGSWVRVGGSSLTMSSKLTMRRGIKKVHGDRQDANGGIFKPNRMWAAVVDRAGVLCQVTKIGDAWPGSRAIAIAKASTANDFSNDGLALSTTNLYVTDALRVNARATPLALAV